MLNDDERDRFFGELYARSTEPFLSGAMTRAELQAFVTLAGPATGARVLDVGCGWGRHLPGLAKRGLRPVGIERSAAYAGRARRETGQPVVCADVRAMPFRTGSFAAAACFYSSLFFFDEPDNRAALAEVARVLEPQGAFVLQTANPMHLRRLGSETRAWTLEDGTQVEEQSRFDRESGRENLWRVLRLPDGRVVEGTLSVRHYAPGELEAMGLQAGLRLERSCGSLSLEPFRRDARELVLLFRRRA